MEQIASKQSLDTATFIEMAQRVHGDKYDYSKVTYATSHDKVTIICPSHSEFRQSPNKHLSEQGCPECAKIRSANLRRKTTEMFIADARKVHGDKYDYSKTVYRGDAHVVMVLCPRHGAFQQLATNHLRGKGCSGCKYEAISAAQVFSTEDFITLARNIHGERYDYSRVVYQRSQQKVAIICLTHGQFRQAPNKHLSGRGCPECAKQVRSDKRRLNLDVFIKRAVAVHGDRYDYHDVDYRTAHDKITIICRNHGPFQQEPNSHIAGSGCPKCNESKGERIIRRYLELKGIPYRQEHRIPKVGYFDFAAKGPVLIEYHGGQHYHPCSFGSKKPDADIKTLMNTLRRDRKKERWCANEDIPLLVIPFWEHARIDDILDAFFAGKEPNVSEPPAVVKKYERMRRKILERLERTATHAFVG
jgi:hypothetical protein